jgi:peptidoglycan/LPS O-acetylase OafA/YrhL
MHSATDDSGTTASDNRLAGRIGSVDGFRGFAALTVLGVHVWYGAGRPIHGSYIGEVVATHVSAGFIGVDFFFVISGFVLFLPTCLNGGRFGSVRSYAVRRTARIVPLYWAMLVVLILTLPLTTTAAVRGDHIGLNLLLHAGFLEHSLGFVLGLPEGFGLNGVVWTLSLEVCFYLLLPLVAARFYARPALWFLLFCAVSVLWRYACLALANPTPEVPSITPLVLVTQLPTYLPHFALGMVGAWILARATDPGRSVEQARVTPYFAVAAQMLGGAGVVWLTHAAGVTEVFGKPGAYDHHLLTLPAATAFLVLLMGTLAAPAWAQRPFDNAVTRKLGEISYGIYLWHLIVIGLASPAIGWATTSDRPPDFTVLLVVVLSATILAAWLSHRLLEQPAIDWAKRRTTRTPFSE